MTAVNPEILSFVNARSREEKAAILRHLAVDAIANRNADIVEVNDDSDTTVGYLVAGRHSPAWRTIFEIPENRDALKARLENPGPTLSLEELMEQLK